MNTYNDIKQRFVDHMMTVDYNKMNTMDLANVALTLKTLYDTEKEDYMSKLLDKMGGYCNGFAAVTPEVTENG